MRTIDASDNPAVVHTMRTRNNGRYNGNGREWATPPEVFDPLNEEFQFTLDPCATPENAKCARYFTEADNGLDQDWGVEWVFMNPPYGKEIYAWTRKAREAAEKGAVVVGLLPASTDLAWWHDDVVSAGAEVRYLRGRVRFITDGPYRASGFFASVIVIWRPPNGPAYHSEDFGPSPDTAHLPRGAAPRAEARSTPAEALDYRALNHFPFVRDRVLQCDCGWQTEGTGHKSEWWTHLFQSLSPHNREAGE